MFKSGDCAAYQKHFADWRERVAVARSLLKEFSLPAATLGVRRRTIRTVPVAAGQ